MLSIDGVGFRNAIDCECSVVAFCAENCKSCVTVENILKSLKGKYNVLLYKIDIVKDMEVAKQYRVMGLPTVILFKNGSPYKQITGACSTRKIEELLQYAGNKL